MDFKNRRIRPGKKSLLKAREKTQIAIIMAGIGVILILLLGIYGLVKSLDFSSIIFSFGSSLHIDEKGHTNILLAGVGGEGHDGPDLTDSIIIASIDYENKIVPMLSIPRDLYVKSKKLGSGVRINEVYYIGKNKFNSREGMEELKEIASAVSGIPIEYYIKVDFKGFKKIVDSLGGVEVTLAQDLYDPYYPKDGTIEYETLDLKAGTQTLDGETALKFARSRKTTSDFDRGQRQQKLLAAIKEKALSLNVLTDPGKIKALYDSVDTGIETDLSINEIIELAKISKNFGKESITTSVINDDPNLCGGYLYTPSKEYFNGSFVLLPAGNNYDYIHQFSKNFLQNPVLATDKTPIQILNGTKTPHIAGEVGNFFNRMCFNIIHIGNAENIPLTTSTIYYKPDAKGERPALVDYLNSYLGYKTQPGVPEKYLQSEKKALTKILIELGTDYLQKRIKNPFESLLYLATPESEETEEATSNPKTTGTKTTSSTTNTKTSTGTKTSTPATQAPKK